MQYKVTIDRDLVQTGTILVDAETSVEAVRAVRAMMRYGPNVLQASDPRIQWDEPAYQDDSFDVTGDALAVEPAQAVIDAIPFEADTMNFGHRDDAERFDGLG